MDLSMLHSGSAHPVKKPQTAKAGVLVPRNVSKAAGKGGKGGEEDITSRPFQATCLATSSVE